MNTRSSSMSSAEEFVQKPAALIRHIGLGDIDPEHRFQMVQTAAYYRAVNSGFDGADPALDWSEAEL